MPVAPSTSSWFSGRASPAQPLTAQPLAAQPLAAQPLVAQGNTSLEDAIDSGNINMVKSLIQQGANVNQLIDGVPALIYTIESVILGDPIKEEIVRILIASGADVNLVGNVYPMTAVYAAVYQGNVNIMEMILARKPMNINTKVQVKKRDTPLSPMDYAIRNMYWDLAKILALYGATITPEQKARLDAAAPQSGLKKSWWGGKRRKTIRRKASRRKTKARKTKSRR